MVKFVPGISYFHVRNINTSLYRSVFNLSAIIWAHSKMGLPAIIYQLTIFKML